ncbi:MAG: WXG100 family type VII secretion target [Pseudonocardiaceae bacterium]
MTSGSDQIKVTFSSIDTAASDTDTIAANLRQQLDDLKNYIRPLVASWTGQASTNYQALQKEWDISADQLNLILHQIAATLRTSSQNYSTAENANANIWNR